VGEENRIHTVNMDSKVVERVERAACGGLLISVGLYDNRQILASLLCPVATHYLTGVLRSRTRALTVSDQPITTGQKHCSLVPIHLLRMTLIRLHFLHTDPTPLRDKQFLMTLFVGKTTGKPGCGGIGRPQSSGTIINRR